MYFRGVNCANDDPCEFLRGVLASERPEPHEPFYPDDYGVRGGVVAGLESPFEDQALNGESIDSVFDPPPWDE